MTKTACARIRTKDFTMSGQSAKALITNVTTSCKRHTRDGRICIPICNRYVRVYIYSVYTVFLAGK